MQDRSHYLQLPLLFLAIVGLSSCASPGPDDDVAFERSAGPRQVYREHEVPDSFWNGDGVSGSPRIVIDLSEQRLRYYKGSELVGQSPVSTGDLGHGTPTGSFRVTEKDVRHQSSIYGDYVDSAGNILSREVDSRKDRRPPGSRFDGANMHYFMRINGPIGMHEGYLPGYPASHGCIRLPTRMARTFYHATPIGTPVRVVGHASNAVAQPHIPVGEGSMQPVAKPQVAQAKPATRAKSDQRRAARAKRDKEREQTKLASRGSRRGQSQSRSKATAAASQTWPRYSQPTRPSTLARGATWYLQ